MSHKRAFAIVRVDDYMGSPICPEEHRFKVKLVISSQERAEAEVSRLNALAEGRDYRYFWQHTRVEGDPST